jgi:HTH-type transcriptional repressor of NAD biosynthesis genes
MLQLTHAACVLAAPAVLVFRASRWLSAPRCPVQATRGQRRRAAPALWGSGAGPPPRPAGQGRLMSAASSFAAPPLKWRRLDDAGQHSLGLAETASSSSGDDDDEQPPPGALAPGGADPVPWAAATALGAGDQPIHFYGDECMVCRVPFRELPAEKTLVLLDKCEHLFCEFCLEDWWAHSPSAQKNGCPTCKTLYSSTRRCKKIAVADATKTIVQAEFEAEQAEVKKAAEVAAKPQADQVDAGAAAKLAAMKAAAAATAAVAKVKAEEAIPKPWTDTSDDLCAQQQVAFGLIPANWSTDADFENLEVSVILGENPKLKERIDGLKRKLESTECFEAQQCRELHPTMDLLDEYKRIRDCHCKQKSQCSECKEIVPSNPRKKYRGLKPPDHPPGVNPQLIIRSVRTDTETRASILVFGTVLTVLGGGGVVVSAIEQPSAKPPQRPTLLCTKTNQPMPHTPQDQPCTNQAGGAAAAPRPVTNQATPEPQSAATLDEEAAVVVNCSESRLESTLPPFCNINDGADDWFIAMEKPEPEPQPEPELEPMEPDPEPEPEPQPQPQRQRHALGVTIGKFYPFHRGHALLIQRASERCERLVVICSGRAGEPVDGATRAGWIRELFPDIEVVETPDDLPEAPDPWATRTLELLAPRRPDVALTAEDYGGPWAAAMGCQHERLDTRITSGTELRADLSQQWAWLTAPAKAHFCKRVVVIGVESSGTTTLAQALAAHYRTAWVPEYGRTYWEGRRHTPPEMEQWETHEFIRIARAQQQTEDDLARCANRVLILDTDALATHVWHRRYAGRYSPAVEAIADSRSRGGGYILYLLTAPDFPFVQDGTREAEGQARLEMHEWFLAALQERAAAGGGAAFVVVSGSPEERLAKATAAIDPLLVFPALPLPPAVDELMSGESGGEERKGGMPHRQ